jgi:hypothetical protein
VQQLIEKKSIFFLRIFQMVDKQQFVKGTDYIKYRYNLTSEEIGRRIGGNRNIIDNPRRGSSKPSREVIDRLIQEFPESEPYFSSNDAQNDVVNDSGEVAIYGRSVELIETQKELIKLLKEDLEQRKEENQRLRDEIARIKSEKGK